MDWLGVLGLIISVSIVAFGEKRIRVLLRIEEPAPYVIGSSNSEEFKVLSAQAKLDGYEIQWFPVGREEPQLNQGWEYVRRKRTIFGKGQRYHSQNNRGEQSVAIVRKTERH